MQPGQTPNRLPTYSSRSDAPRDLRTAAELAARGYDRLGSPRAELALGSGENELLYSTAEARKLKFGLWPQRGPLPGGSPQGTGSGTRSSWLEELFREGFVVIDTETTGLSNNSEIIEVAAVDSAGKVLLETKVWPQSGRVPVASTRVHGLKLSDLMGAPSWPAVLLQLERRLVGRRVLAWNAPFDERMALQSSARWEVTPQLPRFECAMRGYARSRGLTRSSIKLEHAAAMERVLKGAQDHRSLSDAHLTLNVLRRAREGSAVAVG